MSSASSTKDTKNTKKSPDARQTAGRADQARALSRSRRNVLLAAGAVGTGIAALSIFRMARSIPDPQKQQQAHREMAARKPLTEQDLREGEHYRELSSPVTVATAAGKIEVIEFFWYGCPHCYELEPYLPVWLNTLPKQVEFRHVPAGFGAAHRSHQRLFYALQTLGKEVQLRPKIFHAIHVQKRNLLTDEDVASFVTSNGVTAEQWSAAIAAQPVEQQARHAKSLGDSYALDGVPAFAVAGRYFVSSERAGDSLRALEISGLLARRTLSAG